MLEDWTYSAKTLIYHWRGVLKGQVRFGSEWTPEQRLRMRREYHLDGKAMETMDQLHGLIVARGRFIPALGFELVVKDGEDR